MSSAETLFINKILNDALEKRASDIHLTVGNYPVMRIGGQLVTQAGDQILNPDIIKSMVDSIISPEDAQKLQSERDIVTTYSWANRARFRVQIFYQKGYPALSLRTLGAAPKLPKDLGLSSVIINAVDQPKGLILVIGPYNSGRTTTVLSLVESINQRLGKHILTLEKPIEFLLVNNKSIIDQREVGKDVASFMEGMQEALNDDVEVVVVSQMTEPGQEKALLQLVESGKLVIAAMNGQSVITSLEGFMSAFTPEESVWAKEVMTNNLLVATAQRLVPKNGGGIVLAYEILTVNPAVKSVLKDANFYQLNNVMMTSRQDGMISLDRHLADLVKQGIISQENGTRAAMDPKNFQLMTVK